MYIICIYIVYIVTQYPHVVTANAQWNPVKSPLFFQETKVHMGLGAKHGKGKCGRNHQIIFTIKRKDFGLKNRILAWTNDDRLVFERNCHQSRNPASSSKASFFGRLLTGINLKLLTFQSSLREIPGNWHILLSRLGVRDPAREVHVWFWLHQ